MDDPKKLEGRIRVLEDVTRQMQQMTVDLSIQLAVEQAVSRAMLRTLLKIQPTEREIMATMVEAFADATARGDRAATREDLFRRIADEAAAIRTLDADPDGPP